MSKPPLLLKMENGISVCIQFVSTFRKIIVAVSIIPAHQSVVNTRQNIVNMRTSGCMTNILKPPSRLLNTWRQCLAQAVKILVMVKKRNIASDLFEVQSQHYYKSYKFIVCSYK